MIINMQRMTKDGPVSYREVACFIHNGNYYYTQIKVFKDGMIDCWGLVDFEGFKQKIIEGWIVTRPPTGATIRIGDLIQFKLKGEHFYFIEEMELIKEVKDIIDCLNDRPSASERCFEAYKKFLMTPSKETQQILKVAYLKVPEHERRFILGDQDRKDFPIQSAILKTDP